MFRFEILMQQYIRDVRRVYEGVKAWNSNKHMEMHLRNMFDILGLDFFKIVNVLHKSGVVDAGFNPIVRDIGVRSFPDESYNVEFIADDGIATPERQITINAMTYVAGSGGGFDDINRVRPGVTAYAKCGVKESKTMIPKIADIELFNEDGGLPTVKVTFTDGSHTTATCSEADISHFSFEQGIGICLGKKMLGPAYNRLIDKGCKMYFKKVEAQQKAVEDRRKQDDILARRKAKRDARIARRKEKQRQEKVDILAEAIRKAKESPVRFEGSDIAANFVNLGKALIGPFEKPTHKEKVLYLRQLGHTYKEIAEELGISKTTVGRIIRESNKE